MKDWDWELICMVVLVVVVITSMIAAIVGVATSIENRKSEAARLRECEAILRCLDAGATREQCDTMHPECEP